MAKRRVVTYEADTGEALALGGMIEEIGAQMNTTRHINAVTKGAFAILAKEFNEQTAQFSMGAPDLMHHVYEWEAIGAPGAQLWTNKLMGSGRSRSVTWEWRASKTTVPTMTRPDGKAKWKEAPGFDPTELKRIHVFVWKAPMMEYGVTVTISPKLSSVLVFPNPNFRGQGGRNGPQQATFTSETVRVNAGRQEGEDITGNFTVWFTNWWGGPAGQAVLRREFDPKRDREFRVNFEKYISRFSSGNSRKMTNKSFSFTPVNMSIKEGKVAARLLAKEMERGYIGMARRRREAILNG